MLDLKDPKNRKIILYFIGFIIFIATCTALILYELDKENSQETTQQIPENNISGSHLEGDSIAIENEKPEVYEIGEMKENIATDSDFNIHNGATGGELAREEIQSQNEDINSYLANRKKSIANMERSSDNENRRKYNSHGNPDDWTSTRTTPVAPPKREVIDNSDIDNYRQNRRPTVDITTQNQSTATAPASPKKEMSDVEKTRLMRRSGMRDVSNTPNIKINIDTDQTVKNGGTVRLKAMENCIINGNYVPMYTTFYGRVSFADDRVHINVNSIQVDGKIIHCNLVGFGLDGLQGIGVNVASLSATSQSAKDELERVVNINRTAVGRIVSSIFSSNKRNDIRVKLLNNHRLIFTQN